MVYNFRELDQKIKDAIQVLSEKGFRAKYEKAIDGWTVRDVKVGYEENRRERVEIRDNFGNLIIHTVSTGFNLKEARQVKEDLERCIEALKEVKKVAPDCVAEIPK